MVKDLFVRDFDEKLHAKATQIATIDGITLASIVADAVDKWIKNHEKNRHRHAARGVDQEKIIIHAIPAYSQRNKISAYIWT